MKKIQIVSLITISLLTAGTSFARGGGNGRAAGYGGPPKTEQERAARQAHGRQANGGTCDGQGQRQRKRDGQGQGQRRGPQDGSGPLGGGANCPSGN